MSNLSRPEHDDAVSNEVEGFLLWQATVRDAEQRARDFTRAIDWLTTSQRADIEQHYIAESLKRARQDIERIAARCFSLRAEYESRYQMLQRRCVALTVTITAGITAVCGLLTRLQ
ncbi:cytochrome C oxidase subunit I [Streptomyces sp. NPDC006173]|uniref:cytochrome C oxidase subunit I n=1 Tax=Streptomyces sp. NPDC006173 TaxID=3155349 RepID=UPI003402D26A